MNQDASEPMYGTTLLQHRREDEDTREFRLPGDGLYQAQGSGEPGRRYYRVIGGKVRHITLSLWEKTARDILPFEPLKDILDRMKMKNAVITHPDRYSWFKWHPSSCGIFIVRINGGIPPFRSHIIRHSSDEYLLSFKCNARFLI